MKLTEQYDGHTNRHSFKMLNRLRIGTKNMD